MITNLKDLQPGKEYNIYCQQFEVNNKARFICGDTTVLKRDIGYFQFADRGYKPVTGLQLKAMFINATYPHTIFALCGTDLKSNTITPIN